ncbi:DUF6538 domain-containing protein [Mesorhizobium sp.]|uniref:DUF6538 domain-containing protein n=1 Tax=Mesorhizobium sp. TaxID=1871066 RepID=UPI00338FB3F2
MATLPERMMTRSGTFYCRIWVPTDIAPIYGRQIVVRSLRTKDLKTAKSRLARKSGPECEMQIFRVEFQTETLPTVARLAGRDEDRQLNRRRNAQWRRGSSW